MLDSPISEAGITGIGLGAAMTGLRPVVDIMFGDFMTLVMDQVVNQAAKVHYMSGGRLKAPLTVRTTLGATRRSAAQHSQSLHAWVAHIPGLKVALPSTPYDAKGLLKSAIRDDGPVVLFEDKMMFATKGTVPEEEYTLPFGVADVKRAGEDVTLVATSSMVYVALEAAEELARSGISAEVIDPRTLVPLDREALVGSARKTGRVIVVDEGHRSFGASAELAAVIGKEAFYYLDAPVARAAALDVPIPFSPTLEDQTVPTAEGVFELASPSRERNDMGVRTDGTMAVDWEERVDFERLRRERLARAKEGLARSELGALLCFDMANIRYITATHIGTWAMDKLVRFCLLPQGDDPIMWDFGSAARHHKIYSPWLGEERSRPGISTLRGSVKGRAESVAEKIRVEFEQRGLLGEPLGVDVIELPVLEALQNEGITVVDGQALMQDIRKLKTVDELSLLSTACAMVDAAYRAYRAMKPGMRENECVALVSKVLLELGSEHVEGVNAISGERCSPHPHVFTDRMLRPGDPAYFDILHAFNGYRTCYYRTFAVGSASPALVDAYKRARNLLDQAISLIRPA